MGERTISEMMHNAKAKLDYKVYVLLLGIVSVFEILSAIAVYNGRTDDTTAIRGYAIALGCVSIFLCLVMFFMERCVEGPIVVKLMTSFTAVWWVVGALVLTFDTRSGFTEIGNGWISSHAGAAFSLILLSRAFSQFAAGQNYLSSLSGAQTYSIFGMITSLIVLIFAGNKVRELADFGMSSSELNYAVAAGAVGVVLPAPLLFIEHKIALVGLGTLNLLWWIAGVLALGFYAEIAPATPVITLEASANAYFAMWGALVSAVLIMLPVFEAMGFDFFVATDSADAAEPETVEGKGSDKVSLPPYHNETSGV